MIVPSNINVFSPTRKKSFIVNLQGGLMRTSQDSQFKKKLSVFLKVFK